eukprot:4627456-Amphidinium_carterae.2
MVKHAINNRPQWPCVRLRLVGKHSCTLYMATKFRHDEALFATVREFVAQAEPQSPNINVPNVDALGGFDFGGDGSNAMTIHFGGAQLYERAVGGFDFGG